MPTYPTQIVADGVTARYGSPRITGPYKYGSNLFVVNFNPGGEATDWYAAIEVYKSADAGETWTLQAAPIHHCHSPTCTTAIPCRIFKTATTLVILSVANVVTVLKRRHGIAVVQVGEWQW